MTLMTYFFNTSPCGWDISPNEGFERLLCSYVGMRMVLPARMFVPEILLAF
jgi:hypothetical protein